MIDFYSVYDIQIVQFVMICCDVFAARYLIFIVFGNRFTLTSEFDKSEFDNVVVNTHHQR